MRRNFLPLISHLIREVSREDAMGAKGLLAMQRYTEVPLGEIDPKQFDEVIKDVEALGLLESGTPLSCGLTANVFCRIFTGKTQLANTCTLPELRKIIADREARIIRVDLQGHAYVIEQVETKQGWRKPQGNVYQSNIAVIANSELGISLKSYLDENPNPVDLDEYLGQLAVVSSKDAKGQDRLEFYKKMYTVPSYLRKPQVTPITELALTKASEKLEVTRLSYQNFEERDVLRGVNAILTAYRNIRGADEARDIYFMRCWAC